MAVVTHTFLDKTNTIIYGSDTNLGMNPILEMYFGMPYTRGLIYFDISKLQRLVDDKVYPDISKLTHRLKMQNVAGLRTPYQHTFNKYNNAKRAKSFNLNFFLLEQPWDMGGGFDYKRDGYESLNTIYSTDGSNWYKADNQTLWGHDGVFNYDKIAENAIATQHFDMGNESIDIDITEVVNAMIIGELPNYGIGICFDEENECTDNSYLTYVGFFTSHTHTFFKPYVETIYHDAIADDRANFYLDKDNRLYFYASAGGNMVNLDELPTCTIDGEEKVVKQASKGVYYIDVRYNSEDTPSETMFYDVWGNIKLKGRQLPDKELYFTTKPSENYLTLGLPYETQPNERIVPSVSGINNRERIEIGDVRKVSVAAKIAYTTKQEYGVDGMEYRIYSKAGEAEIDVIDWMPIDRGFNENYFMLDTTSLAPGKYFIAIKIRHNMEELIHKELCEFDILDNNKDLRV